MNEMYCPNCGAEYRQGVETCADCDVALVHEPPDASEEDHQAPDYVEVFETSDVDLIPVIKSLLDGAEIPYLTRGEGLMDLFPSQLGGIYHSTAQVKFRVPAERAAEAQKLLEEAPRAYEDPDSDLDR